MGISVNAGLSGPIYTYVMAIDRKRPAIGMPMILLFGLMGLLGFGLAFYNLGKEAEFRRDMRTVVGLVTKVQAHEPIIGGDSYYVTYEFLGRTKREQVWHSTYDEVKASKQVTVYYLASKPEDATIDRGSFLKDAAMMAGFGLMFAGLSTFAIWQKRSNRVT